MENKRYLKKFANESEYNSQKDEVMNTPHVVLLEDTKKVKYSFTPNDPFNGYEYVDLGLPSGTLWASKPITNADGEPLYFQWGDTEGWTAEQVQNGEKAFSWDDYKWDIDSSITKYNATDSKTVLDLEDDAAHVHMGGNWHMPTKEQFEELTANTTSTWTTQNGVNGRLFTASNGNSLFIPAFGNVVDGIVDSVGSYGYVLGSSVDEEYWEDAWSLSFYSSDVSITYNTRFIGSSVLGIISK